MGLNLNLPSPVEKLKHSCFEGHGVEVCVKRDDLIHPEVSGNKWRKLRLNIEKYDQGKYDGILTFGGAYSNHISATAAVGAALGIQTIGIIRGEELNVDSNETLKKAAENGMQLVFVSREEYSWRYETDYKYQLRNRYGNVLVVEEGGANFYGVMGCTGIVSELTETPDYIVLPVGTGTTTSGVLMATDSVKIIGVPVFKNGEFIRKDIQELLGYSGLGEEDISDKMKQLTLVSDYGFGGYGKYNDALINFINMIYSETGLKLDQIYTGKMMYALFDLIEKGIIPAGSKVLAIHTGGLQGTSPIRERLRF